MDTSYSVTLEIWQEIPFNHSDLPKHQMVHSVTYHISEHALQKIREVIMNDTV